MQRVTQVPAPAAVSRGDAFIRRLLRIPEQAPPVSAAEAERSFSFAMLLSATRCIVGYGIAPFALPLLGLAPGIQPWIDIPIGCTALVFDVRGIRRFWLSDHKHRRAATVLYAFVIVFVLFLLVRDVLTLLS